MDIPVGLKIVFIQLIVLIIMILIMKSRYRTFSSNQLVKAYRNGKLRSTGLGGGYFLLPFIDTLYMIDRSMQYMKFVMKQADGSLRGNLTWKVTDDELFFEHFSKYLKNRSDMNSSAIWQVLQSIIQMQISSKYGSSWFGGSDMDLISNLNAQMRGYGVEILSLVFEP
ncbi:MAG: hypothetical protein INQ03_26050 [Candidatus Heimdallarchaeota archaeon]|nr:hypothetical protein [Candidatus Heimdallarchaeota archaeon]